MNNPTFKGKSLEDLKTNLRGVNRRIDSIKMQAATIEGRTFWVDEKIDWNNPKLDHLKETYFELVKKSQELTKITSEMEAIKDGEIETWKANQKGLEFIKEHFPTFEEEVEFYRKNNLTRGRMSLRDAILNNPNYLREVVL